MKKLKFHEKEWLNRLEELIIDNLDNSNYTIARLAQELFLSSASLNRKVNYICNCSPGDYVRKIKLEKARELFETNQSTNLSKVAKKIGYSNPTYFSKIYRQSYNDTVAY